MAWTDAATQGVAQGAAQGVFGIGGAIINSIASKKQQERQMQHDKNMATMNYYYGEMAADAADARQRAQFNDLYSIQAQMKQIKEAGLSPSLMFGGTPSQGGASAPQGAGAQGAANNLGRYQIIDPMMASQIGLMTAQAMKARAEAKKAGAETTLTEAQTAYQELQNEIGNATKDTTIESVQVHLNKMNAAIDLMRAQTKGQNIANEVSEKTKEANIKAATENATNLVTQRLLMEAQTETEKEKVHKMIAEVKQNYEHLQIEWYKADVASWEVEKQNEWYDKQIKQVDEKNHQFYESLDFNREQLSWDKTSTIINVGTEVLKTAGGYMFYSGLMNNAGNASKILTPKARPTYGARKKMSNLQKEKSNRIHVD